MRNITKHLEANILEESVPTSGSGQILAGKYSYRCSLPAFTPLYTLYNTKLSIPALTRVQIPTLLCTVHVMYVQVLHFI